MAIVIRLSRQGRRNRPHFRLGVFDSRTRRDGAPVEYLGHYDPLAADQEKQVTLDAERIQYWLGQGARVTETVRSFLKRKGIPMPQRRRSGSAPKAPSAG
jgi:small subunit ribosomal protein S16